MPSPAGPRALFIYYRVPQAHRADAFEAITTAQQTLMRRLPGVQARLWCRSDEQATDALEQTWMEVYEHPTSEA
jgi:1,2-phenylacetyl-CoA epoxidase PaaB subunit